MADYGRCLSVGRRLIGGSGVSCANAPLGQEFAPPTFVLFATHFCLGRSMVAGATRSVQRRREAVEHSPHHRRCASAPGLFAARAPPALAINRGPSRTHACVLARACAAGLPRAARGSPAVELVPGVCRPAVLLEQFGGELAV